MTEGKWVMSEFLEDEVVEARIARYRSVQTGQCGWVSGGHVICQECTDENWTGPGALYHENIDRYRQDCHLCGKQIHFPISGYWPELYSRKDCPTCSPL